MTPAQSFPSIPIFCTAGNKVAIDSTTQSIGYQPQQQLPCEYYNQLENQETTALNTVFSGLSNITAELDLVVTSGGGTPSLAQTNQLITALNVLYQANGSNWSTALKNTLGNNWSTALSGVLGPNWPNALVASIGSTWPTILGYAGSRSCLTTSGTLGALTVLTDFEYFLSAASTATLPASPTLGQRLTFKNKGNFTSTISANGGQTIGTTTSTSFVLYAQEDYVTLEWDGTSVWYVVATNGPMLLSNQTAATTGAAAGWTAIGNGLSLGTLQPGVYDVEFDCICTNTSTIVGIAIGIGTTPSSVLTGSTTTGGTLNAPVHCGARCTLNVSSIIQGIYNGGNGSTSIQYTASYWVGRISAKRIG